MTRLSLLFLCYLPVLLLTPILEIGATHVFNPDWPGHARLHEVWQLITHVMLASLGLWLAARHGAVRIASAIGGTIGAGFLAAVVLAPLYDGTMRHTDGTEIAIGGVNAAVLLMLASTAGFAALFVSTFRRDLAGTEG